MPMKLFEHIVIACELCCPLTIYNGEYNADEAI